MKLQRSDRNRKLPKRHPLGQSLVLAYGLAAGAGWTGALAQDAPRPPAAAASGAQALEAVVVNARKRDELAINVPISMQTFGEKALRAKDVYDLQDLKSSSGFTLNQAASFTAGGRTLGNLTFRGLQGDSGFLSNENSGGLFVDGIYISAGMNSVNTRDVARIEVLKGPQNAFFGRNTFGGAINFITKEPANTFKGEVNTSATGRGSSDIDATLEGPLIENKLSGRLTLLSHRKAAQYKASDGGDLGAEKTTAITGTLYATPTDSVWLRARIHYQQDDDSTPVAGYVAAAGNTSCAGRTFNAMNAAGQPVNYTLATDYFCDSIPRMGSPGASVDANTALPAAAIAPFVNNSLNDPFTSDTPKLTHTGMRRDVTRASFQAGADLPYDAQWAFNIGYNSSKSSSIWDFDHTISPNYLNFLALVTRDVTIDTRVTSDAKKALRGLVGLSYYAQRYQFAQLDFDNYALNNPSSPSIPGRSSVNYVNNHSSVPAFYAAAEYDILSNLTASVDVRRQSDKITAMAINSSIPYENTAKNWLPRASLRFKPDRNTTVYGTVARGVQQLALNSGYISLLDPAFAARKAYVDSQVPGSSVYSPQPKLDSFELGIKQSLLGNRLQYALAVYQQNWTDRLTNTVLLCPPGQAGTVACPLPAGGASLSFGNDAKIKGIELSVDALVGQQWAVGAYVDYKDAYYTKDYNATLGGVTGGVGTANRPLRFDGKKIPRVPDLTASFNATYRMPLPAGWSGYVRTDASYTGKAWDTDLNVVQTDPYWRVNLRFGADKPDAGLELFVKNLFNDTHWDYAHRVINLGGGPYPGTFGQGFVVAPPSKREIGVRARYAF